MLLATSKCNGKIWVFKNQEYDIAVIRDTKQQITLNMKHQTMPYNFYISIVYAKRIIEQQFALWNDIYELAEEISRPWLVRGDYNVMMNFEEKIRGSPSSRCRS